MSRYRENGSDVRTSELKQVRLRLGSFGLADDAKDKCSSFFARYRALGSLQELTDLHLKLATKLCGKEIRKDVAPSDTLTHK